MRGSEQVVGTASGSVYGTSGTILTKEPTFLLNDSDSSDDRPPPPGAIAPRKSDERHEDARHSIRWRGRHLPSAGVDRGGAGDGNRGGLPGEPGGGQRLR